MFQHRALAPQVAPRCSGFRRHQGIAILVLFDLRHLNLRCNHLFLDEASGLLLMLFEKFTEFVLLLQPSLLLQVFALGLQRSQFYLLGCDTIIDGPRQFDACLVTFTLQAYNFFALSHSRKKRQTRPRSERGVPEISRQLNYVFPRELVGFAVD